MTSPDFIHPNLATYEVVSRQYFSLPFGIISYIIQNSISAQGLLKLQKTCKYFFAKNKIIVVNKYVSGESENLVVKYNPSHKNIYLNASKYWLVDGFEFCDKYPTNKIPRIIYRCNLVWLKLSDQKFTLAEFDFLSNGGKITTFRFVDTEIMKENGKMLSCDKILSNIPNVIYFYYECKNEIFNNEIFQNMNVLKFNSKFECFCLYIYNLEDNTDVSFLCDFIKKNSNRKSYFRFSFRMDNSEVYRTTLQSAIKNTFQDNEHDVYIN